MSNPINSTQETKEASIRRILLRFNDQNVITVVIDEETKVMIVVDSSKVIQLLLPIYMLTNSEVFNSVHSYLTNKLAEAKALNH